MRVLIIDDSIVMRNIHKQTLVQQKFPESNILEAPDGDSALKIAKNDNIDLFIVDWNMPGLDGLEFTKEVRAMEKYTATPIVMVTSEAAKYSVMEAVEVGVTNYIVKPVKGDALWTRIAKYVYPDKYRS